MRLLLQFVLSGLAVGTIFGLIALGWVLIYNVSGVLNLAQGEFLAIGALAFIWLHTEQGVPLTIAFLGAVALCAALGVALDVVALQRLGPTETIPMVLITLGASIILREAARAAFGVDPLTHPPLWGGPSFEVAGAAVARQTVIIWVSTAVLLLVLGFFFKATLIGKAMRACAQNPVGAQAVGINPAVMRTVAFGVSAALAGMAGVLLVPLSSMAWDAGTLVGLKGFVAAVIGGLGSYSGAVVGGLLLGVVEGLSAGYISSAYKDAFAMATLLSILLFRPEGLFRVANYLGKPYRRVRKSAVDARAAIDAEVDL